MRHLSYDTTTPGSTVPNVYGSIVAHCQLVIGFINSPIDRRDIQQEAALESRPHQDHNHGTTFRSGFMASASPREPYWRSAQPRQAALSRTLPTDHPVQRQTARA
ncbi:hypothetical protein JR316_0010095 [Psilocybe cubensis]|uniref:Uncharacterized protein n=1 Tax=Psilocybe cubensis TaxID=181762 RepID=A0ACB8GQG4_PSICU|nr:hypothetical protein JR316_0010095 [Psilocybe cubensis]KAH9477863.1 hypothetical protein JR316_0010095 [Psilocybe cubensis]